MTGNKQATDAGFNSLQHLANVVGVPRRTLTDWSIKSPQKFKAVLLGGMVMNGATMKELKRVNDGY